MNIFFLSKDPKKAAVYQYNKHVVKMILETAQMLCTAHLVLGEENGYDGSYVPYKMAHRNHPSTKWIRSNILHYRWAYKHMLELGEEYTKRYGKTHLTITKCKDVLMNPPKGIKEIPWSDPPQCMPEEYKASSSLIGYWNYYIGEKGSVKGEKEIMYSSIPDEIVEEVNKER